MRQLFVRTERARLLASLQHLVAQTPIVRRIDIVDTAALLVEVEQLLVFRIAHVNKLGKPIEHGVESLLPQNPSP